MNSDRLQYYHDIAKGIAVKHDLRQAEEFLNKHDITTFGIEYINFNPKGVSTVYHDSMKYINTGDTYSITIVKDSEGYHVTTWGDWYESKEHEITRNENKIRCGNCGTFTSYDETHRDTECHSCNYVNYA